MADYDQALPYVTPGVFKETADFETTNNDPPVWAQAGTFVSPLIPPAEGGGGGGEPSNGYGYAQSG
jgi:hypothetical protein